MIFSAYPVVKGDSVTIQSEVTIQAGDTPAFIGMMLASVALTSSKALIDACGLRVADEEQIEAHICAGFNESLCKHSGQRKMETKKVCNSLSQAPMSEAWDDKTARSSNWNRDWSHVDAVEDTIVGVGRVLACPHCKQSLVIP
jgi:hypothetical protein